MGQKTNLIRQYLYAVFGIIAGVLLDQYTKYLAVIHLKNQRPFVIWEGVFQLRYLENRGAAFGILQNRQWVFVAGAILISFVVLYYYRKIPPVRHYLPLRFCFVLLVSGAVGNLIDRLLHQYVIDFFYFELIDFPIFNVADVFVVAACILFVLLFFCCGEKDFEFLFSENKK